MAEIEVKHYKREHKGSREKTLVTEVVQANSETALFLQTLEKKRLTRKCHLTVDMRGKVPSACRSFMLENKVFYLDDISLDILHKGLKDNGRVFTVGTYEAIVNGAHTNRAIRAEQERKAAVERPAPAPRVRETVEENAVVESTETAGARNTGPRYSPEIILSGYYKKRREERLQYVTGVTLSIDGMPYQAKTRDLSQSGLQVYLKGAYNFAGDAQALVSFTEVTEAFGIEGLTDIHYRIVKVLPKGQEVTLRLVRAPCERDEAVNAGFGKLIERLRQKYKCDVEDDLLSVNAWIHERLYTDNVTHIPLFFGRDASGHVQLRRVAMTDRNQALVGFFSTGRSGYDFSAFNLPARLDHLFDGDAATPRELLLILYKRDEGAEAAIHSGADFEFADRSRLHAFVRHAMVHERFRMLRVTVMPLRKPSERKIALRAQRLRDKSQQDMALLQEDFTSLCAIGMAVDVTPLIVDGIRDMDQQAASLEGLYDLSGLRCWVGGERKNVENLETFEQLPVVPDGRPDIVKFGYLERRREERYLLQTQIEINYKGRGYRGLTQDISVRGLKVNIALDVLPDIQIGDTVQIDFIGLQNKVSNVRLKGIEYRIVNLSDSDRTRLMLERVINRAQEDINSFFVDLINRNRHKLPVDIEETLYAAKSRVHESTLAENLVNIPFFLAREEDGGAIIVQKVALNETPCALAGFFRTPDGNCDFSPLLETKRVYYLYDGISLIAKKESVDNRPQDSLEYHLYMYREPAAPGRPAVLRALADFEETEEVTRDAFLRAALASGDYRFVKVVATPISEMHNLEVDTVIDEIREHSRHRAAKLKEGFQRIVGQGEIIDVTEQVLATLESGDE